MFAPRSLAKSPLLFSRTSTDFTLGRKEFRYEITHFVVHRGPSPRTGHYTMLEQGSRLEFDDNNVDTISTSQLQGEFRECYFMVARRVPLRESSDSTRIVLIAFVTFC